MPRQKRHRQVSVGKLGTLAHRSLNQALIKFEEYEEALNAEGMYPQARIIERFLGKITDAENELERAEEELEEEEEELEEEAE